MVIYGVYIVSKSGGLIFNHDHNIPKIETEKVFSYPIDLTLDYDPKRVSVLFGQKDGINGELYSLNVKSNQKKIEFRVSLCSLISWSHFNINKWGNSEWEYTRRWPKCT